MCCACGADECYNYDRLTLQTKREGIIIDASIFKFHENNPRVIVAHTTDINLAGSYEVEVTA